MSRLPLRYSLRNLARRRLRTVLTIGGLALVIAAIVFMLAFSTSLASTFRETGDPDNIIILSKKAQTVALSSIADKDCDLIKGKLFDAARSFVRSEDGDEEVVPLISPEMSIGLNVKVVNVDSFRSGHQRGVLHGVNPELALRVNSNLRLVDGSLPLEDERGLLVGRTTATRIGVRSEDLQTGAELTFLNQTWTVVGHFESPGTVMDSEILTHVQDLRVHLKRQDYSFIKVKLKDASQAEQLCERLSTDEQFGVKAFPEQMYFADYAEGFDYFRTFAHALAVIISIGGILAGMNTMYTAVMGRVREIGALQVIGFSKRAVFQGILIEAVIIALSAGILGCGLGYLANGLPMNIPMAAFRVHVGWEVFLMSLGAALLIGLVGACIPAYRALRLRMVDAVRHQ